MAETVFSKIVSGELPSHKLFEDELCIVILSIDPIVDGHALVIPKEPVDYIWNTGDDLYVHLWSVAKKISPVLQEYFGTSRVLAMVDGAEIAHTHIHILPSNESLTDLSKDHQTVEPDHAALAALASKLAPLLAA